MGPLLTVPKMVLIVWPKIPQMLQNLPVQVQKFGISMKKGFIWPPQSVHSGTVHSRGATAVQNDFIYPYWIVLNHCAP